jgi:hypothetical protein
VRQYEPPLNKGTKDTERNSDVAVGPGEEAELGSQGQIRRGEKRLSGSPKARRGSSEDDLRRRRGTGNARGTATRLRLASEDKERELDPATFELYFESPLAKAKARIQAIVTSLITVSLRSLGHRLQRLCDNGR